MHPKLFFFISLATFILFLRILFTWTHSRAYVAGDQIQLATLLLSDVDPYAKKNAVYLIMPDTFPPQRIQVLLPQGSAVHYGQYLTVSGTIKYRLLTSGSTMTTVSSPHVVVVPVFSDGFFTILYQLRKRIIVGYRLSISDVDSALLLGIVFGIKGTMPASFSQAIRAVGVTHVIAASGMNVTMVAGFLIAIFTKLFTRKIAIAVSLLGLVLYAIFAGVQPSILRATLMGIALFGSQLLGRQYKGWYILCLTGYLMVVFSPGLIFDIGFQLSFLSTLGILFVQPLFAKIPLLTEDIATTVSAQLATVPILVINFGQYNLLSVIVNGLVLWTIPPLMLIGTIAAFVGLFSISLERLVLFCAIPFLWIFEAVVGFFAGLPILLNVSEISSTLIIIYYLVVIAVLIFIGRRKQESGIRNQDLKNVSV